jgi:hypothetical protein
MTFIARYSHNVIVAVNVVLKDFDLTEWELSGVRFRCKALAKAYAATQKGLRGV